MIKLSTEEVAALLWQHWRLRGDISALPSYADHNYRVSNAEGIWVLKIANPCWDFQSLDLENQAMLQLARTQPALQVPRVLAAQTGAYLLPLTQDGETVHLRVLSYVPGTVYAEAQAELKPEQRPALHRSLGREVGRLTTGLSDFQHPAADRSQDWNLMSLPSVVTEVANIADPSLRAAVQKHAGHFCQQLAGWRQRLPIQVLHNDANDLNVLVTTEQGEARVSAVIDFGDMCRSFRLADLAIACTYAIQFEADPLACAGRILQGYRETCPLTPEEEDLLFDFILARLCQSILMSTQKARLQPDNPFILVSQKGVRALLMTLTACEAEVARRTILEHAHV